MYYEVFEKYYNTVNSGVYFTFSSLWSEACLAAVPYKGVALQKKKKKRLVNPINLLSSLHLLSVPHSCLSKQLHIQTRIQSKTTLDKVNKKMYRL